MDILRCAYCGVEHLNPLRCETYRFCHVCEKEVRSTSFLKMDVEEIGRASPLKILAASYGKKDNASLSADVTEALRNRMSEHAEGLVIDRHTNLPRLFQVDPAPGKEKALRIRYSMNGRKGELLAEEKKMGYLYDNLLLMQHEEMPMLMIHKATYGHPHSTTGKLFDVTERMVAMVDAAGGSYLNIPTKECMRDYFGDPSPGTVKTLTIDYEIVGKSGEVKLYESNGTLKKKLVLDVSPIVAPILLIDSAYFGRTDADNQRRVHELKGMLNDANLLKTLKSSKSTGKLSRQESASLVNHSDLLQELKNVSEMQDSAINVTYKVQGIVDTKGGDQFCISSGENLCSFLNVADPCPRYSKFFQVQYQITGLGASSDDSEITSSGYIKNFVTKRKANFKCIVDESNRLNTEATFQANRVLPALQITRASFGHPTDTHKLYDITLDMVDMLIEQGGRRLEISKKHNFVEKYGDPCRGVRKVLNIQYRTRGLSGVLSFPIEEDRLQGRVQLGYRPRSQVLNHEGFPGFVERSCATHGSKKGLHTHYRNKSILQETTRPESSIVGGYRK